MCACWFVFQPAKRKRPSDKLGEALLLWAGGECSVTELMGFVFRGESDGCFPPQPFRVGSQVPCPVKCPVSHSLPALERCRGSTDARSAQRTKDPSVVEVQGYCNPTALCAREMGWLCNLPEERIQLFKAFYTRQHVHVVLSKHRSFSSDCFKCVL